jgi:hypothetical protein
MRTVVLSYSFLDCSSFLLVFRFLLKVLVYTDLAILVVPGGILSNQEIAVKAE